MLIYDFNSLLKLQSHTQIRAEKAKAVAMSKKY